MAKKRTTDSTDHGSYMRRGGRKIPVEKEKDRFTVIPSSKEHLERLGTTAGVREVKAVSNEVFKVKTSSRARDKTMATLRSDRFQGVVHHAYRPTGSEGTTYYLTDKIIAHFVEGATHQQIDEVLHRHALKVLKEYDGQPNTLLLQVTSDSGGNPIKVANRLAEEDLVVSAEPNLVNRFISTLIPNDSYFPRQWHLQARDAPQLVAGASVNAPEAWDITRGERGIVVAIIDDGFDLNHPDFQGRGKIVSPRDYVDGDAQPFPDAAHGDYHGTPCAGIAIAESNGRGVVGIAHGCAFMPVRFPHNADDDLLIEIFEETARHCDVISCSWSVPPVHAPLSAAFANTLTRIAETGGKRGKGCVICFAAANFDAPINDPDNTGGFPWLDYGTGALRLTKGPIFNGLAAHPGVIAVAASTSLNKHAAYSNWGPEVGLCAPSNNFHPRDQRKHVPGRGIWTTDNEGFGKDFTARSRYTNRFGGTSSAAPMVAGVAALVLSANPNLTAAEVKEILHSTADKIVDGDPDIVLATNRGRYDAGGRCDWFGSGKVNAARAVKEAKQRAES